METATHRQPPRFSCHFLNMIKAAILAGPYSHPDIPRLVQLLHDHPDVELMAFTDTSNAGRKLSDLFPTLTGETELIVSRDLDLDNIDVVFVADAKGSTRNLFLNNELPEDLRIIDMTGDFRLPGEGNPFVQGIPELNRKAMVRGAKFVSMPNPAVTAVTLALLPLAKSTALNGSVHSQIVSNLPGADTDSLSATRLDSYETDQIKAAVTSLQEDAQVDFSGILFAGDTPEGLIAVTVLPTSLQLEELRALYDEFYDDHSFTFVVDNVPDINDVRDTNKCFIHLDKDGDRLVVTTVLDTDMKGGAGNAVHAMNLLFGLLEKVGL